MENKVVINKASSPKSLSPSVFIGDPIGDLQRSVILETATTTTHVEDSRQRHSGMTTLFNGLAFTLIELLVVVLIIGILAAVAVPQYQKAVDRARMAQLVTLTNAVKTAQEEFYLANNTYSTDWNSLSVSFDGTIDKRILSNVSGWKLQLVLYVKNSTPASVYAYDTRLPGIILIAGYAHSGFPAWDNQKACYAEKGNKRANDLCKVVSGKTNGVDGDPYYTYRL